MAKTNTKQQKATKPENWDCEHSPEKNEGSKGVKNTKSTKGCKNCK